MTDSAFQRTQYQEVWQGYALDLTKAMQTIAGTLYPVSFASSA